MRVWRGGREVEWSWSREKCELSWELGCAVCLEGSRVSLAPSAEKKKQKIPSTWLGNASRAAWIRRDPNPYQIRTSRTKPLNYHSNERKADIHAHDTLKGHCASCTTTPSWIEHTYKEGIKQMYPCISNTHSLWINNQTWKINQQSNNQINTIHFENIKIKRQKSTQSRDEQWHLSTPFIPNPYPPILILSLQLPRWHTTQKTTILTHSYHRFHFFLPHGSFTKEISSIT